MLGVVVRHLAAIAQRHGCIGCERNIERSLTNKGCAIERRTVSAERSRAADGLQIERRAHPFEPMRDAEFKRGPEGSTIAFETLRQLQPQRATQSIAKIGRASCRERV